MKVHFLLSFARARLVEPRALSDRDRGFIGPDTHVTTTGYLFLGGFPVLKILVNATTLFPWPTFSSSQQPA